MMGEEGAALWIQEFRDEHWMHDRGSLINAFTWRGTEPEYDYWKELHKRVCEYRGMDEW